MTADNTLSQGYVQEVHEEYRTERIFSCIYERYCWIKLPDGIFSTEIGFQLEKHLVGKWSDGNVGCGGMCRTLVQRTWSGWKIEMKLINCIHVGTLALLNSNICSFAIRACLECLQMTS